MFNPRKIYSAYGMFKQANSKLYVTADLRNYYFVKYIQNYDFYINLDNLSHCLSINTNICFKLRMNSLMEKVYKNANGMPKKSSFYLNELFHNRKNKLEYQRNAGYLLTINFN
ncbi:unnamed protein product [Blepharisma stoltei]|uniref:Uncharacterized protein n=1 Tax=Blepharisma stoltei TaxID=1481888 RepID=A0AAU9KDD2_9CILI|nr:unnamed protein product [Blepharisma stoltei]